LIGVVLLLTAVGFGIFWKFWYRAPSCFDSLKNGDETGVDCGGSCALLCSESTLKPILRWDPRLFEVTQGLWSALIYVENPNASVDGAYVPYTLSIYGANNQLIETRNGATILPKNKTVGIFEGNIVPKNGVTPKRAVFDISSGIVWQKNTSPEPEIEITHSPLLNMGSAPRIEATVKNSGIVDLENIELVAAIFDGSDNAIAASRTFVEDLKKDQSTNVFFTWPKPFALGTKACEEPSNVMLLLDRSGSMSSISSNPPEPLTQAKNAAASFVRQLRAADKVGLVSFATQSKNPIDLDLTGDFASAESAVQKVSIETSGTQYTNIYDALRSARQELLTQRASENASKIIILLTDGVATSPKSPTGRTEADDVKYAESLALQESAEIKKEGETIYSIGLGKDVNTDFLKQIASSPENYFLAPTASDLMGIYRNISSAICNEIPARIEITYKIFGNSF